MLQVKTGQVGRLAELFERHHQRIYRFCFRMTGNDAVSQDLVQEVFMRVLKYRESFRDDSRFLPWVYGMARNACIDHFRRNKREPVLADELPEAISPEPPASEKIVVGEDIGRLRKALLGLPPEKREILVLTRFESRKHAEIAEILDCSVGAVKVRVHRAVKQLREIYMDLAREAAS